MFQPASLKGESPVPVDERIRRALLPLYYLIIIMSFFPISILEYYYILVLWQDSFYFIFLLLFPLNIFVVLHLLQLSALIIAGLILKIVNLIHTPKEGIFNRNIKDKEYFFWNIRNIIKKWPLYLTSSNPFPWWKNRFALRFFGVEIGKHSIVDNSWLSSEFLKVGKNVILGMNSTAITFGIEQDKFFIKEILIEDDVLIGAKCSILPGTHIKRGVKVAAYSYTDFNEILEEYKLYGGHPAKLITDLK